MKVHELKTWPEFFDAVKRGEKTFEVRFNDRDYQVGDVLLLLEWDPASGRYTGQLVDKLVTYVCSGGKFGIEPGTVVLGIR